MSRRTERPDPLAPRLLSAGFAVEDFQCGGSARIVRVADGQHVARMSPSEAESWLSAGCPIPYVRPYGG